MRQRQLNWTRNLSLSTAAVLGVLIAASVAEQPTAPGGGDVAAAAPRPIPAPAVPLVRQDHWGKEPVEPLTPHRGRIVLNGLWNFMPAVGPDAEFGNSRWGTLRVPGSWIGGSDRGIPFPGGLRQGQGPAWQQQNWRNQPPFGVWYARTFTVPAEWDGRAVDFDVSWIESAAEVYIDGQKVGQIVRPHGTLEITDAIKPGTEQTMLIHVILGRPEAGYTAMGVGFVIEGGRMAHKTAGILGDAVLLSRPKGTFISDVFVQPSTRRKALGLDLEFTGIRQAGTARLTAEMLNEQGEVEIVLEGQAQLEAAEVQRVFVELPWENPRLWDYRQPNLYTMRLRAQGAGLNDTFWQPFGFREVWIEGREVMLNGSPIRLRMGGTFSGATSGVPELVDLALDALLERGHNLIELWPEQPYQTTRWNMHVEVLAQRADRKGIFLTGVTSHAAAPTGARGARDTAAWDNDPEVKAKFRADTDRAIRRLRNHPSLLMWGSTGNFGMHADDQNPRRIGQDWQWAIPTSVEGDQLRRYREAWQIQKQADPTRPVFWHASLVGDIQTINWYLNFIPLQEREEWLSEWVMTGTRPVTGVEFGLPYTFNFQRMRSYDGMGFWEILGTEHLADLLGEQAYQLEGDHMWRWMTHALQKIGGPDGNDAGAFMHHRHHLRHPDYTAYQIWYEPWVRNTWRSWRTWGMSIMPIPWGESFPEILEGQGSAEWRLPEWQPGQLGSWLESIRLGNLPKMPPGEERARRINTTRQQAIQENNGDTLAWIAGPQETFTAKDHAFWSEEAFEKSLVVINDTRKTQDYQFDITVMVDGRSILADQVSGRIDGNQTVFHPIRVQLPPVDRRVDGQIIIRGTIGRVDGPFPHEDKFDFRIHPRTQVAQLDLPLKLWDPIGHTSKLLDRLGLRHEPWDGQSVDGLIVIGREALSSGQGPGDLRPLLERGARIVVMAQHPDWTRDTLNLRVAPHLARRVWRTDTTHPVVAGLDDIDLRDWRGQSTLVDPYPHYIPGATPP